MTSACCEGRRNLAAYLFRKTRISSAKGRRDRERMAISPDHLRTPTTGHDRPDGRRSRTDRQDNVSGRMARKNRVLAAPIRSRSQFGRREVWGREPVFAIANRVAPLGAHVVVAELPSRSRVAMSHNLTPAPANDKCRSLNKEQRWLTSKSPGAQRRLLPPGAMPRDNRQNQPLRPQNRRLRSPRHRRRSRPPLW